MCCGSFIRIVFGILLVLRMLAHALIAVVAARDLIEVQNDTSGPIATIGTTILKKVEGIGGFVSGVSDLLTETKLTMLFYILGGVLLLLASLVFPWSDKHRSRVPYYAALHGMFVAMVIYMVYVRGLIPLKYLREVYEVVEQPALWPAILLLDTVTILAACVPPSSSKPRSVSYTDILPLVRGEVYNVPTSGPMSFNVTPDVDLLRGRGLRSK